MFEDAVSEDTEDVLPENPSNDNNEDMIVLFCYLIIIYAQ
jgi:hypothetical protein